MKKVIKFIWVLIIIIIIFIICFSLIYLKEPSIIKNVFSDYLTQDLRKKEEYKKCMSEAYKSDTLESEFNEIMKDFQNVSIYFKDINNDYTLNLNSTKVYYSASTSKLFDIIYLVEEARKGNINLNDTLTYKPSDARQASIGMKQHKYYDEVKIIDMIKYMLLYSDNTAHFMLVDYIGVNTINEYFKDINLKFTHEQPFINNYTALVAKYSLERMYEILQVDDEYTSILRESMNNKNMNYLSFDNIEILHKYGYYDMYFHDIGIYESDNPYIIAVLTLYGNGDYESKINKISQEIYNLYKKNLEEKALHCKKNLEN